MGMICFDTTKTDCAAQQAAVMLCRTSTGSKGGAAHRGGSAEAVRGPAAGDRAARCPGAAS